MNIQPLPRLRSFRLRIALLSTLISAVVLVAFGLWTWELVQRTGFRRVDQSIRELGERHLVMRQPPQYWEHARESLEFVLGEVKANPFIFLVKGRDGKILHVSDNWPLDIDRDQFPTPVAAGFTEAPERWGPSPGLRDFHSHKNPPQSAHRGLPLPDGEGVDHPALDMNETLPADGGMRGRRHGPPLNDAGFDRAPFHQNEMRPPGDYLPNDFPPFPPDGIGRRFGPPKPMPIRAQAFFTTKNQGNAWRIGVMSNPEVTFVLGLNLAPYAREMERLGRLFLMAAPAALLLIGVGGGWLAQRALRPVLALTKTAEGITAQGLDQRIPMHEEDVEFDRLIRVFNGMLDRLEKSFQQAVRFSADAAHELKTPLTILQGELEQAVQSAESGSEQQQALNHLLEEVQRLKAITRKLLLLSLADSGQLKPQLEPVNFSEVLKLAGEDIAILAPHLDLQEAVEDNLWVNADPDLIRQVIQNLTSNAVKYNAEEGTVAIQLAKEGEQTVFTIGNSGPGIPDEDRERVFERFYRTDKAHTRRVDGYGLGLSLSREIMRAHHGELVLQESRDGWTVFRTTLPAASPPSDSSE